MQPIFFFGFAAVPMLQMGDAPFKVADPLLRVGSFRRRAGRPAFRRSQPRRQRRSLDLARIVSRRQVKMAVLHAADTSSGMSRTRTCAALSSASRSATPGHELALLVLGRGRLAAQATT